METIILTSLSETGEYLDGPNFFKDVWPVLEKNLSRLEVRMRLKEGINMLSKKYLLSHKQIAPDIWQINTNYLTEKRSMDWFASEVCYGHVEVLFKCNKEDDFFRHIVLLWPFTAKDVNHDLTQADVLKCFGLLKLDEMVFSFGHDGDPMFVCGSEKQLKQLLDGK